MNVRRPRRIAWKAAIATAAVAVLALTACSTGAATVADGERQLVIARAMDVSTLDPQRGYCDTCQIVLSALYETVVTVDPEDTTKILPRLATEWTNNEDYTSFTFILDPEATFADGSAVEAADVKWTFERLLNLQGSASFLMAGLASIDTPDATTVTVNFSAPNSAFLAIVAAPYTGIVNSELAEENGASAAADAATADVSEDWFLQNSAGSGPYTLAGYEAGQSVELTRSDEYWGAAPTFPSVLINEVTDSSSQLQQLQQGDVDIAMQVSSDSIEQLAGNADVTTELVDSFNYIYLEFAPGAVGGEVLDDPRVREAIKYAIDYDKVIDATVGGNGKTQGSPIPNGFEGSEDQVLPEYNVEKAKELLAEAGLADGFTLPAAYPKFAVYGVDFDVMMQSIQQDLVEVGITLELQPLEYTQWAEILGTDGSPLTAVYFAPDHTDSSQYVSYFGMVPSGAWSETASVAGPVTNQAEVEGLATALTQSGADRAATYTELGKEMASDLIILPIVNPQLVLAYASDVTGVEYSPCCNLDLAALGLK
ncbi:peptide/nickel transport system substrate-binding protein [Glaciihabitans tibetensis]|uniref:Peptide/nickel transport system substrate-binding protein n=1 Tax=Glaciihabitans tibetensis TaxID=1266600 RepID=A0A2T0VAU3_9MICO|nr:ABC transporter substrate-binding protein [Glaciihabitans tibetensis]PRY67274.1 peptide/nickel transport system substrate-binding protein [Glaciihabitans tibetensis]